MIPVTQRGSTCWLACLASIFEVPLEEMPTFEEAGDHSTYARNGYLEIHRWLAQRNLSLVGDYLHLRHTDPIPAVPGYSILTVRLAESHELHALVVLNGEIVWDPCGYAIPRDWNGLAINGAHQIAKPIAFSRFMVLDPINRFGPAAVDVEQVHESAARTDDLFRRLYSADKRPCRPGVDYGAFIQVCDRLAAAYCDAATEADGVYALLNVLDDLRELVLYFEEQRRRTSRS